MAEVIAVIGVIANIVGIIDGIDKARPLWKKYFQTSSALRAELLPVLGKLTAFAGILRGIQLQCELDESDVDRLRTLQHIEDPLRASEQAVRLVANKLDQTITVAGTSFSLGKVMNKETAAALRILDETKTVLDLALAADQRILAKSIESYVRNVAEHVRDARLESKLCHEEIKGQLHAINSRETESLQAQAKADVLAWISQVNYSSNYHAAQRPVRHSSSAGEWCIAGETFCEWKNGTSPRLLLNGICKHSLALTTRVPATDVHEAGSGKTVLCAKMIDHIVKLGTAANDHRSILYFFFDFNDAAKESVQGMVRALLHQLVSKLEQIPDNIRTFYANNSSSTSTLPSTQDWVDLFCFALSTSRNTFIFIDALDECAEAEHMELRSVLSRLLASTSRDVRWLITCRPNNRMVGEISSQFFKRIEMETKHVSRDIASYLCSAMEADPRLSSFSRDARECIINEIKSSSGDMFRYAQCQLDSIARLRDRRIKKVKDALSTMPRDLFASYRRILDEAKKLDDWPIIERILVLVSFSARPVTIAEAAEFAILEDDMVDVEHEDRMDITDMLCAVDVLITVREGIMTLAHKSVQEFFAESSESHMMSELYHGGESFIASRCLQYLRIAQQPVVDLPEARENKEPNTTQLNRLLREYPFLDYAATRWPHHLRERHAQEAAIGLMAGTLPLTCKPNLWKAWLFLQRADIWENQIQLARLLCEFFIRGSLVTGWSRHFWHQRQAYRVRSDTAPRATPIPTSVQSIVPVANRDAPNSYFWAKAVCAGSGPAPLAFRKGDVLFVHSIKQPLLWTVSINGRTSLARSSDFERCAPYVNTQIVGSLCHDLAVLLTEVAFQSAFPQGLARLLETASSETDFAAYLSQFRKLIPRIDALMGSKYGEVIKECLTQVRWRGNAMSTKFVDLRDSQEVAMQKLCKPLEKIFTTGFHASRSLVKTWRRPQQQVGIVKDGRSSDPCRTVANIAPLRAISAVDPVTYGTVPYNLDRSYRAASAEPAYFHGAAVASHTAMYPATSPLRFGYRPSSTNTIALGYAASVSTYTPSESSARSVWSAPPSALPLQAPSAIYATQRNPPARLGSITEILAETTADEHSGLAKMLENMQSPFEAAIILGSDAFELWNTGEASARSRMSNLWWQSPDELIYIPTDQDLNLENIPPRDHQTGRSLADALDSVCSSSDQKLKLRWAREVFEYLYTSMINRDRASKVFTSLPVFSGTHFELRSIATGIVLQFAERGDPEAIFLRTKWAECGCFGFVTDKVQRIKYYTLAANKGYARAWYRLGLLQERSNEEPESFQSYTIGCQANDAASLYRLAMKTVKGEGRHQLDLKYGIDLLHKAAATADEDAPQALYTLGMIYAQRLPALNIPTNIVEPDWGMAVSLLEKAAIFGFAKAQFVLGSAYEVGDLGLEPNLSLALHYYILAARRGEADAEMGICKLMLTMWGKDMTVDGIGYAYAKRAALDDHPLSKVALEWYRERVANDARFHSNLPEAVMTAVKTETVVVQSGPHELQTTVSTTAKIPVQTTASDSTNIQDVALHQNAGATVGLIAAEDLSVKPPISKTSRFSKWSGLDPVLASFKLQIKSGSKNVS